MKSVNWKRIAMVDAVASLISKNIFRDKQTTKKVPLNIFKGFKERTKVRLMF